jgi:mRNA interferase HigB
LHVISRKRLLAAATRYPDLSAPLDAWYRVAKRAKWRSLADIRRTWSSADLVDRWTVFNIKGNKYRLITAVKYNGQRVYIKQVITHTEYNRGKWRI